jgi:hypothetical protein
MKLTRYRLKKHIKLINKFFKKQKRLKKESIIYKSAKKVTRNANITINYSRNILDNIYFISDSEPNFWAETDGVSIWLNASKQYDDSTLYYTLLHECLHGMVYRDNMYYLSEPLEHKMMELIDSELI